MGEVGVPLRGMLKVNAEELLSLLSCSWATETSSRLRAGSEGGGERETRSSKKSRKSRKVDRPERTMVQPDSKAGPWSPCHCGGVGGLESREVWQPSSLTIVPEGCKRLGGLCLSRTSSKMGHGEPG